MTIQEAKGLLIPRLDFRGADAPTTDSGRYYEDSHFIVTLANIEACRPEETPPVVIEDYLTQLKESCAYAVLGDCFDRAKLGEGTLVEYPALFDNALAYQMSITIINLIMSSTRSNFTERITKEMIQRIHFDLNGNYGATSSPNYPRQQGIASKYMKECRRIQNRLGGQKKLVSFTVG